MSGRTVPLVDRSGRKPIETVLAAFLADRFAAKSGADGAACIDGDSSRHRIVMAASPARYDASAARIRVAGVDG
jgi:hypothetical protein